MLDETGFATSSEAVSLEAVRTAGVCVSLLHSASRLCHLSLACGASAGFSSAYVQRMTMCLRDERQKPSSLDVEDLSEVTERTIHEPARGRRGLSPHRSQGRTGASSTRVIRKHAGHRLQVYYCSQRMCCLICQATPLPGVDNLASVPGICPGGDQISGARVGHVPCIVYRRRCGLPSLADFDQMQARCGFRAGFRFDAASVRVRDEGSNAEPVRGASGLHTASRRGT